MFGGLRARRVDGALAARFTRVVSNAPAEVTERDTIGAQRQNVEVASY